MKLLTGYSGKTIALLSSSDIEMVKLGCALLTIETKRPTWKKTLETYIKPSFIWYIDAEEITIIQSLSFPKGLWQQLATGTRVEYNKENFTLDTFTQTINELWTKTKKDN